VSFDSKENASQSPTLNYRERSRKLAISLCLVGILAGGVLGELLREWMVTASHERMVFAALLNSVEVRTALEARSGVNSRAANSPTANSPTANQMIRIDGPWVRDAFLQDGKVSYFVLADGSFYFDSVRPPLWLFPMVLLCPVLGFVIPWGVMKALGFTKKPTPPPPAQL